MVEPSPARPAGRRLVRRFVIGLIGVTIVLAVVIGALSAWGIRRFNEITFVDVAGVEPAEDGQPANWLLVGTDGREGIDPSDPNAGAFLGEQVVGKRTDTIVVARVDSSARTVDLLSVPRDLWVPIAGRDGTGRINGAYNGDDGRETLVATLEGALGIEINHYAEVNFVGFQEIVDAMDGVPIWFDHPARDVGSGLHIAASGCHVLDGSQALALARSRTYEEQHADGWRVDPTGDLGRTERQRLFLRAVIGRATADLGITSIGRIDGIAAVAGKNLVLEDGVSIGDLVSLARTFAAVDDDQIVGHGLPVTDHRTSGGAQVLLLDEVRAAEVLDTFRSASPPPSGPGARVTLIEPIGSGLASAELDDGKPVASIGSAVVASPGYGSFGYTDAPSPEGTICG